jgi:hypothetical protein
MGLLDGLVCGAIRVVTSPIEIVDDVLSVAFEGDTSLKHIKKIANETIKDIQN